MSTITWRRGSADPLVFQPVQADGTPAPLDGLAMQLRVQAGSVCIPLDGVATGAGADAGFEVSLMPLIDLPPRVYRASEYYDAGNGWRWVADHALNIEGGC